MNTGFSFLHFSQAKLVRYICKQRQCKLSVASGERTPELNSYPRFSDWLYTFNVRPEVVQMEVMPTSKVPSWGAGDWGDLSGELSAKSSLHLRWSRNCPRPPLAPTFALLVPSLECSAHESSCEYPSGVESAVTASRQSSLVV
ncbi:hypothetical protein P7K49_011285 [Saguinus oedipus]|uniref:Uncharacterized protein n=1 Tax=Saguinus oedipus TaxID=9490 RepID=A0ABQ9VQ85_SAGOE|nr:hypothetical protein P7K49_011285 [Saguinus oedipus]